MQSYKKLSIVVVVMLLVSTGFAQVAPTVAEPNAAGARTFPYIAEITGTNVYVRSGAGTNYYTCGKLNKGDRVSVVSEQFGWCRIVPPPGSFSWISMQFVRIDPTNPKMGNVTGDMVRVYAGSEFVKPMHSTSLQLKLNKNDNVKLFGEQKDGYYKIVPPTGAYLWVSGTYTKDLGPVGTVPPKVEVQKPKPEPNKPPVVKPGPKPGPVPIPGPNTPAVVPSPPSVETKMLKQYHALEKLITAEKAKPLAQQDYDDIKKELRIIADNKEAGKAARYSNFAMKLIKRYEIASEAAKAVQRQETELKQRQQKIKQSRSPKQQELVDLGKFVAVGMFKTSSVYGREPELVHYRVVDSKNKTVCYAVPTGAATVRNFSSFVNKKVGLVGKVEPHPETAGALVRFTQVVALK